MPPVLRTTDEDARRPHVLLNFARIVSTRAKRGMKMRGAGITAPIVLKEPVEYPRSVERAHLGGRALSFR